MEGTDTVGRLMPVECEHGAIVDWGDFGDGREPEGCTECEHPELERPYLSIDPALQGGAVCVPGTRIPADVLGKEVWAGYSVNGTARAYEVSREMVLLCCWWWGREQRWHKDKLGRLVNRFWGVWLDDAHQHFAIRAASDLADPPKVPK